MSEAAPLRVGVVGLGYWGPNLARNFDRLAECELLWICDASEAARSRWESSFPGARVASRLDELLAVDDLDAVVARLRAHGADLIGEVVQYEDTDRLCYVRGPEGIMIALAEALS